MATEAATALVWPALVNRVTAVPPMLVAKPVAPPEVTVILARAPAEPMIPLVFVVVEVITGLVPLSTRFIVELLLPADKVPRVSVVPLAPPTTPMDKGPAFIVMFPNVWPVPEELPLKMSVPPEKLFPVVVGNTAVPPVASRMTVPAVKTGCSLNELVPERVSVPVFEKVMPAVVMVGTMPAGNRHIAISGDDHGPGLCRFLVSSRCRC